MPAARLTQIRLRNFKSIGPEEQTVDLKPLTVLIGRNNSGKSTVIQSLMLLKQTLDDPRPEVQLALQGSYVRATSLRELTHGWPADMEGKGPVIALRWETPSADVDEVENESEIELTFGEINAFVILRSMVLTRFCGESIRYSDSIESSIAGNTISHHVLGYDVEPPPPGAYRLLPSLPPVSLRMNRFMPEWSPQDARGEQERFAGVVFIDRHSEGLSALRDLISSASYVSSSRDEALPYYPRPTGIPGKHVLPRGENAPELLYGRRSDLVHTASLDDLEMSDAPVRFSDRLFSAPLKDMVDTVLGHLGISQRLSFSETQELGVFRMFFGGAALNHVGRGIGHVLPVIAAGLLTDPLLGRPLPPDTTLSGYLDRCEIAPILALEELESHLHPKAQTKLADFLVALARSGRQLIVETHSDHLVRRLRSLIARTAPGSESERWLLENVNIVEVEQSPEGVTYLHQGQLTREGSIEKWPADFMDESANEERGIYFAALEKAPPAPPPADEGVFEDVPPANGKG